VTVFQKKKTFALFARGAAVSTRALVREQFAMELKRDRAARGLSIYLTRILRHTAPSMGVSIRSDGFILVDDLLKMPRLKSLTLADLQRVILFIWSIFN
jgi:RNA:NAD 2'-phosphotransferase (TPT1/KptA family)